MLPVFDFLEALYHHRLAVGEWTQINENLKLTYLGDHLLRIELGNEIHDLDFSAVCHCRAKTHNPIDRR